MKPLIVINFKNYKNASGDKAYKLAKYCAKYDNVIVCPQLIDLSRIAKIKNLAVFSQHADLCLDGAHTGRVCINNIKQIGAKGTLLNHSENRIPFSQIKQTIQLLKKQDLKSIVCCEGATEAKKIAELKPDYIAYEPKELIGTNKSVSESKPKIVKKIVDLAKPVKVLIGAGIKNKKDVKKSMKLGAKGVLLASGIVKARNPKNKIKELAIL